MTIESLLGSMHRYNLLQRRSSSSIDGALAQERPRSDEGRFSPDETPDDELASIHENNLVDKQETVGESYVSTPPPDSMTQLRFTKFIQHSENVQHVPDYRSFQHHRENDEYDDDVLNEDDSSNYFFSEPSVSEDLENSPYSTPMSPLNIHSTYGSILSSLTPASSSNDGGRTGVPYFSPLQNTRRRISKHSSSPTGMENELLKSPPDVRSADRYRTHTLNPTLEQERDTSEDEDVFLQSDKEIPTHTTIETRNYRPEYVGHFTHGRAPSIDSDGEGVSEILERANLVSTASSDEINHSLRKQGRKLKELQDRSGKDNKRGKLSPTRIRKAEFRLIPDSNDTFHDSGNCSVHSNPAEIVPLEEESFRNVLELRNDEQSNCYGQFSALPTDEKTLTKVNFDCIMITEPVLEGIPSKPGQDVELNNRKIERTRDSSTSEETLDLIAEESIHDRVSTVTLTQEHQHNISSDLSLSSMHAVSPIDLAQNNPNSVSSLHGSDYGEINTGELVDGRERLLSRNSAGNTSESTLDSQGSQMSKSSSFSWITKQLPKDLEVSDFMPANDCATAVNEPFPPFVPPNQGDVTLSVNTKGVENCDREDIPYTVPSFRTNSANRNQYRDILTQRSIFETGLSEDEARKYPTFVCPRCNTRQREFFTVASVPGQFESPAGYLAFYFAIYVIASLYIFGLEEGWPALDCVYFSVITLTTTGLGDYVPTSDSAKIVCSIFIYFGVACIGLLLGSLLASSLDDASRRAARETLVNNCQRCNRDEHYYKKSISSDLVSEGGNNRRGIKFRNEGWFSRSGTWGQNKMSYNSALSPPDFQGIKRKQEDDSHLRNRVEIIDQTICVENDRRQVSKSQRNSETSDPLKPLSPTESSIGSLGPTEVMNRQLRTRSRHYSIDLQGIGDTIEAVFKTAKARLASLAKNDARRKSPSASPLINHDNTDDEADDSDGYYSEASLEYWSTSSEDDILQSVTGVKAARYVFLTLKQAVANSLLIIAIGSVGFYYIEKMTAVNAFYFTTVLLTTVGYGDIVPHTSQGKLFATIYVLVAGTVLLHNMSMISMIPLELRKRRLERAVLLQFGDKLDESALRELANGPLIRRLQMSEDRPDGLKQCTREMFALAMLIRLGRITEQDVRSTFAAFRRLDLDNDGRLSSKEIILSAVEEGRKCGKSRDDLSKQKLSTFKTPQRRSLFPNTVVATIAETGPANLDDSFAYSVNSDVLNTTIEERVSLLPQKAGLRQSISRDGYNSIDEWDDEYLKYADYEDEDLEACDYPRHKSS